jgi:DNA-binding transcriptional ArsR family regulator
MSIGHSLPVGDVAAGTAFEVLAELAAASRLAPTARPEHLRDALDAVGDSAGESWLNLLGVPLDAEPPYSAERLVATLRAHDPVELRRVLLGRYAWSWCTLGGTDDIDAAAAGDADAIARLLDRPRYYAGHAASSLAVLLSVDPAETQRRLVAAVEAAAAHLAASRAAELDDAAGAAAALLAEQPLVDAIERVAGAYRYVPELEAERVVLVPHLERGLPLVLAQHRTARVILYPVAREHDAAERLLALGRALSDPKRVEILALVGRGTTSAASLVDATRLTRSTVHHHLALLRDAGLVALEGNARAYTYVPRPEAAAEAAALLGDILGTEED